MTHVERGHDGMGRGAGESPRPSEPLRTSVRGMFYAVMVMGLLLLTAAIAYVLIANTAGSTHDTRDRVIVLACAALGAGGLMGPALVRLRPHLADHAECQLDGLHLTQAGEESVYPWTSIREAQGRLVPAGRGSSWTMDVVLTDGSILSPEMFSYASRRRNEQNIRIIESWCARRAEE